MENLQIFWNLFFILFENFPNILEAFKIFGNFLNRASRTQIVNLSSPCKTSDIYMKKTIFISYF